MGEGNHTPIKRETTSMEIIRIETIRKRVSHLVTRTEGEVNLPLALDKKLINRWPTLLSRGHCKSLMLIKGQKEIGTNLENKRSIRTY